MKERERRKINYMIVAVIFTAMFLDMLLSINLRDRASEGAKIQSEESSYLSESELEDMVNARFGESLEIRDVRLNEDNPPNYELELKKGGYIHKLKVHAITGGILEWK